MKKFFLFLSAALVILSCNQKSKKESGKKSDKNTGDTTYVISKYGLGDIKIGMTQAEVEKLLKKDLAMKNAKDPEAWLDTAVAKYKDVEVSLFFQPQYKEDQDAPKVWELFGLETSNSLCKTAAGIGIGDNRVDVVSSYEENYIDMGPEYEQVNDTTWLPSKTKYSIRVSGTDDDKELFFKLSDKKIASLGVSIMMGDH